MIMNRFEKFAYLLGKVYSTKICVKNLNKSNLTKKISVLNIRVFDYFNDLIKLFKIFTIKSTPSAKLQSSHLID